MYLAIPANLLFKVPWVTSCISSCTISKCFQTSIFLSIVFHNSVCDTHVHMHIQYVQVLVVMECIMLCDRHVCTLSYVNRSSIWCQHDAIWVSNVILLSKWLLMTVLPNPSLPLTLLIIAVVHSVNPNIFAHTHSTVHYCQFIILFFEDDKKS